MVHPLPESLLFSEIAPRPLILLYLEGNNGVFMVQYNRKQASPFLEFALSTSGALHILFWLMVLIILTILEGTRYGFLFTLSNEVINTLFYCIIVYVNLFYLFPHYFNKKQFLSYAALLILASLILTPLKMLVFYFKFEGKPEAQQLLLANQFGYFLTLFIVSCLSTTGKIVTDWITHIRNRQDLETQNMQSELRFLKSQINPHFLFNTLNSLYALTLKKSDLAPEIVLKLSEMMRYMLYECNEKRVLLSKEINYLQHYIDLERIRQGKQAQITFEVSGDVQDLSIAPLLFIPFLENSFKHGIQSTLSQGGYVRIAMRIKGKQLHFHVENSKPGTLPARDPNRPSGGIGLVNVHRRLNLLYPNRYDLKIDDTPHSYAVELILELD